MAKGISFSEMQHKSHVLCMQYESMLYKSAVNVALAYTWSVLLVFIQDRRDLKIALLCDGMPFINFGHVDTHFHSET